jgi:hypothetical protein
LQPSSGLRSWRNQVCFRFISLQIQTGNLPGEQRTASTKQEPAAGSDRDADLLSLEPPPDHSRLPASYVPARRNFLEQAIPLGRLNRRRNDRAAAGAVTAVVPNKCADALENVARRTGGPAARYRDCAEQIMRPMRRLVCRTGFILRLRLFQEVGQDVRIMAILVTPSAI